MPWHSSKDVGTPFAVHKDWPMLQTNKSFSSLGVPLADIHFDVASSSQSA